MADFTVKVVFNHLPQFQAALGALVQQAVDETAFAIQATAQQRVPVLTGTLRRSIHTITPSTSGYASAIGGKGREYDPEAPKPQKGTAIVGVAANYGKHVEYGTRHMAARPYLIPAMEEQIQKLPGRIEAKLRSFG